MQEKLIEIIVALLEPMQKRRAEFSGNEDYIIKVIRDGAVKANIVANKTLRDAKEFMKQLY